MDGTGRRETNQNYTCQLQHFLFFVLYIFFSYIFSRCLKIEEASIEGLQQVKLLLLVRAAGETNILFWNIASYSGSAIQTLLLVVVLGQVADDGPRFCSHLPVQGTYIVKPLVTVGNAEVSAPCVTKSF